VRLTALLTCSFALSFFTTEAQTPAQPKISDTVHVDSLHHKLLQQVVVTARQPIIQQEIDRLRFNVAGTDLAAGNTLWGLLEKTPLVTVSEDGTIQIAGTTGAVVYINNKRKVLSGLALKSYLSALPSDNVVAIEVMTTPSSKYEAEGGAGILNIVTKKSKEEGFDGNVVLTDRETALNSQSVSAFLNDRTGKWDIYSDLYLVNRRRQPTSTQDYTFPPSAGSTLISNDIKQTSENQSVPYGANLGIDYQFNPDHIAGLLFDYSGGANHNIRNAFSNEVYPATDSLTYSNNVDHINSQTYSLNLNYDGKLDPSGKRLSIDLDALRYTSSYNSVNETNAWDGVANKALYVQDYFRSSSPQQVSNESVKADFKWPLRKGLSLEMGAKLSFSEINNNLLFENNEGGNVWVRDTTRSNIFRYDENIVAAYVVLNHKINARWSYQLGTRVENTIARGYLNGELAVNRNYVNGFPTAFLKFSPKAKQTYVLAVSSRITRPSFWDVNPFRTYTTDKTYFEGNPFLLPSRYYREELRRTLPIGKASYTFLLAASQTLNEFFSLPYNDTGDIVVYRRVNYGNKYSYTMSMIYSQAIRPWWQFSGTVLTGYEQTAGSYAAIPIDNKTFLLNLSTNQTFTISRKAGLTGTLIANNSLPYKIVDTHVGDRFDTEIRLRKTAGPLAFTLSVTDIFKANRDNFVRQLNGLNTAEDFYYDTRSVAVTMNYNFGKSTVKNNRDRDMPFQDAKDRIM
jgi:hypothetical protein